MVETMRIGQLAKAAGVAPSALRYYDAAGLLDPEDRTDAGYRMYSPGALGRLQFIQRARALGLSLREVRELLDSRGVEVGGERDRLRHAVAHRLATTRQRVAALQSLEQELQALYVRLLRTPGPGCGRLGDCACWLPTDEEVKVMDREVACCTGDCCATCDCDGGGLCDGGEPCDFDCAGGR
jgi:DNA-binding transcriptional MerR regulator